MTFPSASGCALPMPASLPAAASGAGQANFLTPEFSGHEMTPGAMRKVRKNKDLDVVPADSRPPRVVEVASIACRA
jgi:hypothetical protein